MTTKEHTYKNWLAGKFELSTVYAIVDPQVKELPPLVNPLNIQDQELSKIRVKQQEIFESRIDALKTILIKSFNERYTTSPFPQTTLKLQVNEIIATVRGQKMKFNSEDFIVERTGQLIPKRFYLNFQNYMNQKLNGIEIIPNFIPSPNSVLFNDRKYLLPEVYIESLIKLYEHLSKFDDSIDATRLFKDPYKSLFADEPYNDEPGIFVSGYGLQLFHQIEEALIIPPGNPGEYALIHRMLIHCQTNAIKPEVSLVKLFEYIKRTNGLDLNPRSNKPAVTDLKKNILRFFLRRYFYKTRSHDKREIEELVYKVIEQKTT